MARFSWRWAALAALAVALMAGGGLVLAARAWAARPAGPAAGLAGTQWVLVSLNGQAPVAGRALTLRFGPDGQLTGDSGCNSYGGAYQLQGATLAVTQLVSTLRACAEQPLNDQETAFQQALGHAAQFTLRGPVLTLANSAGGEALVFQKQ
jgi:heat shock protein HslJ